MRSNVKVISESKTGLNTIVSINGRNYTNNQAYNKAERNEIPGYHGVKKSDGTRYIRSNPDHSKKNNLG